MTNHKNEECWLVFLHCYLCRGKGKRQRGGNRSDVSSQGPGLERKNQRWLCVTLAQKSKEGCRRARLHSTHGLGEAASPSHPRPGAQPAHKGQPGAEEERGEVSALRGVGHAPQPHTSYLVPQANCSVTSQDASRATQSWCVPEAWGLPLPHLPLLGPSPLLSPGQAPAPTGIPTRNSVILQADPQLPTPPQDWSRHQTA